AFRTANSYRPFGFFYRARRHHADRHDLVMRGVGGIAPTREAVEPDAPADFHLQPPFQPRQQRFGQTRLRTRSSRNIDTKWYDRVVRNWLDRTVASAIQRHKLTIRKDAYQGRCKMAQNSARTPGRHALHIPGPTPLPDRVLRAMDTPVIDHRGPEFS